MMTNVITATAQQQNLIAGLFLVFIGTLITVYFYFETVVKGNKNKADEFMKKIKEEVKGE